VFFAFFSIVGIFQVNPAVNAAQTAQFLIRKEIRSCYLPSFLSPRMATMK